MTTPSGGPAFATRTRASGGTVPTAVPPLRQVRVAAPRVPPTEPRSGRGALIVKTALRDPDQPGQMRRSDQAAQRALLELHVKVEILFDQIASVTQADEGNVAKVDAAMNKVREAIEKIPADGRKLFAERVEQNVTQMRPAALLALQQGAQELWLKNPGGHNVDQYTALLMAVGKELAWKQGMQHELDQQMNAFMHALVLDDPAAALNALREVENLSQAYVLRLRLFDTPQPHEETTRMVLMVDAWRRNAVAHPALHDAFSTPGAAAYQLSAIIDHVKGAPAVREYPQLRSELEGLSQRMAVMSHWLGLERHGQAKTAHLHDLQQSTRDAMLTELGVHVDAYESVSVRAGVAQGPAQDVIRRHLNERMERRIQDSLLGDPKSDLLGALKNPAVKVGDLPPTASAGMKYAALCELVGKDQAPGLFHLLSPKQILKAAAKVSGSPASPIRGPGGVPGALLGGRETASVHVRGEAGHVLVDCTVRIEGATEFKPVSQPHTPADVLDLGEWLPSPAASVRLSAGSAEFGFGYKVSRQNFDVEPASPLWFAYELTPDEPPARGRR